MAQTTATRPRGTVSGVDKASWWARLWQPFWTLPAALAVAAVALGVLMPELDRSLRQWALWVFPGGADAARGALTTIASVTISTVGVVFSITMVVLQLASSQFTPRVLGPFLQNRIVQATFGLFIATFVFSLTVLRSVLTDDDGQSGFVPRVSVSFAFLLVLGCVGLFLAFIRSITDSIRVSTVMSRIGDRTMALIDKVMPGDDEPAPPATWSPAPGTPRTRLPVNHGHGHVDEIDLPRLVRVARAQEGVLVLEKPLGAFVTDGQLLATFWGASWDDEASAPVNRSFRLVSERTLRQDITFGFRQLIDIADRALSPGVNDPTTATEVVNELHRLLRPLVQRVAPSPYVADEDGVVRVVASLPDPGTLLRLSVEEIAHYGRDAKQVPERLASMLDDLASCALPRYRATIAELRAAVGPSEGSHG